MAVATDPTGASGITFLAIRFAGADSGKLQQVFLAAAQASGDYVGSVSVGGKNVIKSKDTAGTSFSYFYVKNDTVLGGHGQGRRDGCPRSRPPALTPSHRSAAAGRARRPAGAVASAVLCRKRR